MNTTNHPRTSEALPRATVKRSHLSGALWLIPAGAILLCVWFFYRDFVSTGPSIKIYFDSADGLDEKDTAVRFRGIQVGEVKSLEVSADHQHAVVKVKMMANGRGLTHAGSAFWIVRPELNVGSISGLGTLVSGDYIAVRPGNGPLTNSFNGMEKEPPDEAPRALLITLTSPSLSSLQEQSPIIYRGVQVGEVLHTQLGDDSRNVVIQARIWEDYAPLVRAETKFWNAGGLDLHLGLFNGLQINAASPRTIVGGGIEFATPPAFGDQASNGAIFELNEKAEDKWKTWNPAIALRLSGKTPPTNEVATSSKNITGRQP